MVDTWVAWLIGVTVVVTALLLLPWLAQRTMDHAGGAGGGGGGGGGTLGVLQEIFHPAAHRAEHSIVQLKEREQPASDSEDEDPGPGAGPDEGPDEPAAGRAHGRRHG